MRGRHILHPIRCETATQLTISLGMLVPPGQADQQRMHAVEEI
jgi:hypothetical protein